MKVLVDTCIWSLSLRRREVADDPCRRQGIHGSHTDFLLCAIGEHHDMPIFTIDDDFKLFADRLPVALHSVE